MNSFRDTLDTILVAAESAVPDHGEDCFCCASGEHAALVSVFDGCGGLGSRMYPGFKDHTGAYIASRLAGGAVYDWFRENEGRAWTDGAALTKSLGDCLRKGLQIANAHSEGGLKLRGSMVRDFPTTAAIALVEQEREDLILHVLWAGDSRVYLLNTAGLMQITADDVEGDMNALENLSNDGALTNVLSSDGKFELHYKAYRLPCPTMVFAATDGCFGYLPTPMDFEYMILRTLQRADTPMDFRARLAGEIKAVTGDDFAFAMMSFGFGDFSSLRQQLRPRYEDMAESYIRPLREAQSAETVQAVWEQYRKVYECCL